MRGGRGNRQYRPSYKWKRISFLNRIKILFGIYVVLDEILDTDQIEKALDRLRLSEISINSKDEIINNLSEELFKIKEGLKINELIEKEDREFGRRILI